MTSPAIALVILSAAILYAAGTEYLSRNLRDAGLLAGCGSACAVGGLAIWLA